MRFPKHTSLRSCLSTSPAVLSGLIAVASFVGACHSKATAGWTDSFFLTASAVCVLSTVKAYLEFRKSWSEDSPSDLEGAIQTIWAILSGPDLDSENTISLRMCLHTKLDKHQLQQVTEYIGETATEKQKAGRKFPVQSGIIGKAVREKKAYFCSRTEKDPTRYQNELVKDWHYTPEDAKERSADRMSWAAIPIPTENPKAVLYCDCCDPDFFTEERQNILLHGCLGIAAFAMRRYS